jgi:hypothetical protein
VTFKEIIRVAFAEPFRPFRIELTSGTSYDIRHPDMVAVGKTSLTLYTLMLEEEPECNESQKAIPLANIKAVAPLDLSTGKVTGSQQITLRPSSEPESASRSAQTSAPPRERVAMMTFDKIGEYLKAEPFRPFRIKMASGQTYDIRHPEMILVGKNLVRVYTSLGANGDGPPQWHDASMLLMEVLEPIIQPSSKPDR